MDSHDSWEKKVDDTEQGSGNAKKITSGTDLVSAGDASDAPDLKKLWEERLVRAATAARMRGSLSGSVNELVQNILQPRLSWREILRDMVMNLAHHDFRLIPPAKKHLWRSIYLPRVFGEHLTLAVGIDTSGSVSAKQFQEFIAEIKGIIEQFEQCTIHLFFCDARVHHEMVLTPQDEFPHEFPKENGGTSFVPVFEKITELELELAGLVYLTDGEGLYPKDAPEYPVIWVLNKKGKVPWGEYVELEVSDA